MGVYERLAEHLDRLPAGFKRTEEGVELRILQRLFSEEEARLALHLTLIPEEARVIARRARMPVGEAAERLEAMTRKGLIINRHKADRPPRYGAAQFAVGIYEFQVETMDEELARDVGDYFARVPPENWQQAPQLRTIPVGESIPNRLEVMNYEQAEALIETQDRFRLSPCICRKKQRLLGKGCDKPLETCLAFGSAADYYARNGIGRAIGREEALAVLELADEAGLVLQPANTQRAGFICCCCGDCCAVLQIAKRHPRPATILVSTFYAVTDEAACTACGDCELRCQMEAISVDGDYAVVDLNRCIGCGLCVTGCPEEAITLARKPEADQPLVPANTVELYARMLRARGAGNTADLVGMQVRSKIDRLLSSM